LSRVVNDVAASVQCIPVTFRVADAGRVRRHLLLIRLGYSRNRSWGREHGV